MKNSDENPTKNFLLEMVEYSPDPYILIDEDTIYQTFKPIPKPDKEEMEARLALAARNVFVKPIHEDAGKSCKSKRFGIERPIGH